MQRCRVYSLGFKVQGLELRIQDLGFGVQDLEARVKVS